MKIRHTSFPIILFILALLLPNLSEAGLIRYSPPKPKVGETVRFENVDTSTTCIAWHFGDGAKANINNNNRVSHKYNSAGTYRVKAWDMLCDDGGAPTAQVTIKVLPRVKKGSISFRPKNPKEGDDVTLTASGFKSSCVKWNINGSITRSKSLSIKHRFSKPGKYKVTMYADCGKDISGKTTFSVRKIERSLHADKTKVDVNQRVNFFTRGFVDKNCVLWRFDTKSARKGGAKASHSFSKEGNYVVKAYDYCGKRSTPPESVRIQVKADKVKDTGLTITRVDLRFDNQKKSANLKTNDPLSAQATFYHKGKGNLQYQWLIDNQVFGGMQNLRLHHTKKKKTTVRTPLKLPTTKIGTHKLSLRFLRLKPDSRIPEISYTVDKPILQAAPVTPKPKHKILLLSVSDKQGNKRSIKGSTVNISKDEEEYFNVAVTNDGKATLENCTLKTTIDGKQADSKSVPDVIPGGSKPLSVLLKMPSSDLVDAKFILINKSGQTLASRQVQLNGRPPSLAQVPLPPGVIADFKLYPNYAYEPGEKPTLTYHTSKIRDAKLYRKDLKTGKEELIYTFKTRYNGDAIDKGILVLKNGGRDNTHCYTVNYSYFVSSKKIKRSWDQCVSFNKHIDMVPIIKDWQLGPEITQKGIFHRSGHLYYDEKKGGAFTFNVELTTAGDPANYHNVYDWAIPECRNFKIGIKNLPKGWNSKNENIPKLKCGHYLKSSFRVTIPPGEKITPNKNTYDLIFSTDLNNKFPPSFLHHDYYNLLKRRELSFELKLYTRKSIEKRISIFRPAKSKILPGEKTQIIINIGYAKKARIHDPNGPTGNKWKTLKLADTQIGGYYFGYYPASPLKDTTYTLEVEDKYGIITDTTKIEVVRFQNKPRIYKFELQSKIIKPGESTDLCYDVYRAADVKILEKDTGKRLKRIMHSPQINECITLEPKYSTVYQVNATNAKGTTSKKTAVIVQRDKEHYRYVKAAAGASRKEKEKADRQNRPYIDYFKAKKAEIKAGELLILSYYFRDAETAEISYQDPQTQTTEIVPITVQKPGTFRKGEIRFRPGRDTKYTLKLTNPFGSVDDSVAIRVKGGQPIPQMPKASKSPAQFESIEGVTELAKQTELQIGLKKSQPEIKQSADPSIPENRTGVIRDVIDSGKGQQIEPGKPDSKSTSPASGIQLGIQETVESGLATESVIKTVISGPQVLQFYFDPPQIAPGEKTTLHWSYSSDRDNPGNIKEISPGKNIVPLKAPSSQGKMVLQPKATTYYQIVIQGKNKEQQAKETAHVTIIQPEGLWDQKEPFISLLTATPHAITQGQTSRLDISYTFVSAIGLYDKSTNKLIQLLPVPKAGKIVSTSVSVKPEKTTTYVVKAENRNGLATKEITVEVARSEKTTLPQMPNLPPTTSNDNFFKPDREQLQIGPKTDSTKTKQPAAQPDGKLLKLKRETLSETFQPGAGDIGKQVTDSLPVDNLVKEPQPSVAGVPKIIYFYFDPTEITIGEKTKLYYKYINGGNRHGDIEDPDDPGKGLVTFTGKPQGEGVLELTPKVTQNYHMLVSGSTDKQGSDYRMARIVVHQPKGTWGKNKPLISKFTVSPATTKQGETAQLAVEYTHVSDAGIYDKTTGKRVTTLPVPKAGKIVSISVPVKPEKTTTYVVKAENRNGLATKEITVEVARSEKTNLPQMPNLPPATSNDNFLKPDNKEQLRLGPGQLVVNAQKLNMSKIGSIPKKQRDDSKTGYTKIEEPTPGSIEKAYGHAKIAGSQVTIGDGAGKKDGTQQHTGDSSSFQKDGKKSNIQLDKTHQYLDTVLIINFQPSKQLYKEGEKVDISFLIVPGCDQVVVSAKYLGGKDSPEKTTFNKQIFRGNAPTSGKFSFPEKAFPYFGKYELQLYADKPLFKDRPGKDWEDDTYEITIYKDPKKKLKVDSFSANRHSIKKGEKITLSFTTANADGVILYDCQNPNSRESTDIDLEPYNVEKAGKKIASSSRDFSPVSTTNYCIKAYSKKPARSNDVASSRPVKIEVTDVAEPIIHSFKPEPKVVPYNGLLTLHYDFENAYDAVIKCQGSSKNIPLKYKPSVRIKGKYTYSRNIKPGFCFLHVKGSGKQKKVGTAEVKIEKMVPTIHNFSPRRKVVTSNGILTLEYDIENATKATLSCQGQKATLPIHSRFRKKGRHSFDKITRPGVCLLNVTGSEGSDKTGTAFYKVQGVKEPEIHSFSGKKDWFSNKVTLKYKVSGAKIIQITRGRSPIHQFEPVDGATVEKTYVDKGNSSHDFPVKYMLNVWYLPGTSKDGFAKSRETRGVTVKK